MIRILSITIKAYNAMKVIVHIEMEIDLLMSGF